MVWRSSWLLLIPAISISFLIVLYLSSYLSLCASLLLGFGIQIMYLLFVTILLGLWTHPYVREINRSACTYYYRTYQDRYYAAVQNFHQSVPSQHRKVIEARAQFLALYWDEPETLVDQSKCRCCMGYIVSQGFQANNEVAGIFEEMGFLKTNLPAWRAAEASMRVIFWPTYMIAPCILIKPVFNYVQECYRDVYNEHDSPMYELCDGFKTTYGYILSPCRKYVNSITPFPPPERKNQRRIPSTDFRRQENSSPRDTTVPQKSPRAQKQD